MSGHLPLNSVDSKSANALRLRHEARRFSKVLSTYRGVITILVLLVTYFCIALPGFRTNGNFQNMVSTNAVLLIVAVGMTFPMLSGGFDLSVAGIDALAGILLSKMLLNGVPLALAIVITIGGAILFGMLTNGLLIGYFGVNFFIVTLGTLTITQGLALQFTQGSAIPMFNQHWLMNLAVNTVWSVPDMGLVAAAVLVLGVLCLRYTGFGRMVYAVGGNPEASRLAGISVPRVRLMTYAISAGLAGIGGVLEVGRLASAGPTTDSSIELTAAAAVLIGGVAFGGGVGTLLGTLLGVAFLGVLQSGLLISGISSFWQGVITGAVLIASVTVDRVRARRKGAKAIRGPTQPAVDVNVDNVFPKGQVADDAVY
jgi:ribose transport system permease protein